MSAAKTASEARKRILDGLDIIRQITTAPGLPLDQRVSVLTCINCPGEVSDIVNGWPVCDSQACSDRARALK